MTKVRFDVFGNLPEKGGDRVAIPENYIKSITVTAAATAAAPTKTFGGQEGFWEAYLLTTTGTAAVVVTGTNPVATQTNGRVIRGTDRIAGSYRGAGVKFSTILKT